VTSLLEQLLPTPRLLEVDHVDLAAPPERVWPLVRHADLARSPLVRAFFALRAVPERLSGRAEPHTLRLDDLCSSPEKPGFQVLLEDAPHEVAVGAIGQVWQPVIPFVHAPDAEAFLAFSEPEQVKVAWSIRVLAYGAQDSRVEIEVRVDATDNAAWRKFERYFRLIGPGSHLIRRSLLHGLVKELGTPEQQERERPLPGDALLSGARAEVTEGITLAATPARVWPWLVQMGCHRAGFYSFDWLDNGGERSSRELVPELQKLEVGEIIPATPDSNEGFEVLEVQPEHTLVLGGLYDSGAAKQLSFHAPRPEHYWHVTWAFVLERLDESSTRLHVRARAAFPDSGQLHALYMRPVHHFMQRRMLEELALRVEARLPQSDLRDVLEGIGGAALMITAFLTPFLRSSRSCWGLSSSEALASRPGDQLVPAPDWSWTHAVEVSASAELVWQWVAQIGADRGGFYSYQWLENLVGCGLRNADAIHQAWELELGDHLALHPKLPPLQIALLERVHHFVAHAPCDAKARAAGKPWATASWLFQIEALPGSHCRLITRYRAACSSDLATRLAMGKTLLEPIGFAMDRRMLLGIKERAERQAHYALTTSRSSLSGSSSSSAQLLK
jgi:hypothetical protein